MALFAWTNRTFITRFNRIVRWARSGKCFRNLSFPEHPRRDLTFEEGAALTEECEQVIRPHVLGTKTCNSYFLGYSEVYRRRGWPVIVIFRDIRDALVRDPPRRAGGKPPE